MTRATASASSKKAAAPQILPLPPLVLDHHLQTLQPLLNHWNEKAQTPPVLLLTGLKGIGKRSIAHYLAQWALCEKNSSNAAETEPTLDLFGASPTTGPRPCQTCAACLQVAKNASVNLTEILPEEGETSLKIEPFRKLKETQGFGAWGGSTRAILIPNAEWMTPQAANSLLKLLEEPPTGWIFVLTASDSTLLLPTLLSRCQIIRLKPFSSETLGAILRNTDIPEPRITAALAFASGSWKRAISATDDSVWTGLQSIQNFTQKPAAELDALLDWTSKDPDHYSILLDELERHLAQKLRSIRTTAEASQLASFWIEQSERISRARQELSVPLNRKLQIQNLLIPWLEKRAL